jgi:pantothenate kinase
VPPAVTLVVTEGNYLLTRLGAWSRVRPLLDEVWYVETPDDVRIGRLIDRHVVHGRSSEAARAWVMRSDEANARLVASTRAAADAVIPYGADPAM